MVLFICNTMGGGCGNHKFETNIEYTVLYNIWCLYLVEMCFDTN